MRTIDYKIVRSNSEGGITSLVKAELPDWEPLGGVAYYITPTGVQVFLQALVLREKVVLKNSFHPTAPPIGRSA